MYEICLLRKNRSYFWARCSSTHILFKNWMCELRIFFNADAIITIQHFTIWEICSHKNWLRCTRFVNWLCSLNFCDPWHRDLRIRCLRTNFSLEIDFPAFKFHGVRECCKMQLRDWKSRVLHHTTVRISSTSMTWNSISTVENVSRIGKVLLLRSPLRSCCHRMFCKFWFHSTRRRCQIPWFSRYFEVVLLEQVVVQKRFRRYPSYWVFQAAIQNRGEAQFCNSDLLRVDW